MKPIYKCRVCGKYVEEPYHCGERTQLFLDSGRRTRLSKLLSGLLRHYPWEIGLRPSSDGWVSVRELVRGIRERWRNKELYQWVTEEHVRAIAMLDPKGRFELNNDRIRARYGHSIPVEIEYPAVKLDKTLYHGTSLDRLTSILSEGIKPMKRRYVHLTLEPGEAVETGKRHGKPVVLAIDPACLEEKSIKVYRATSRIYLAKYVPPECIKNKLLPT